MGRILAYVVISALVIAGAAWACSLYFRGPAALQAIVTSAGVAFTVQLLTFGMARALVPTNLMAGWAAGSLVRFAVLALHGFVGVPILGQHMDAALMSLVAFFFLTMLVEPFFLPRPANPTLRATQ